MARLRHLRIALVVLLVEPETTAVNQAPMEFSLVQHGKTEWAVPEDTMRRDTKDLAKECRG